MKKKWLIVAAIGVAVPLVVLAGVTLFIDPIVRVAVQKGGSAALKVPVTLQRASVHFAGRAELNWLVIANPPGYSEPRAVVFDRFDARVSLGELCRRTVHIDEVVVEKPELTLELVGLKSNLSVLMDNLPPSGEKPESSDGKKFLIRKLRIVNGAVHFRSDVLPGGAKSLNLPSIELENIGNAEGGATMGELLRAILGHLGSAALTAGDGVLPANLLDSFSSGLKDLPGRTLDELKKKTGDELENKVKGLFDKKRPD